ncbi:hypothetical protein ACO0LG_29470, partial [Undibacterium sp. Ji42W]
MFIKTKQVRSVMGWIGSLTVVFAFCLSTFGTASAATLNLTGATIYGVDKDGGYTGNGWDTVGSNGVYNLYFLTGSHVFLNTGDGLATSPSIDLSVAGTYTFLVRSDGSGFNWTAPFVGLNLFFNTSIIPGISVSVPFNVTAPVLTPWVKPGLGIFDQNPIPGANSLSFVTEDAKVTMTAFSFMDYRNPVVAPEYPDLVGSLNSSGNGLNDYSATITLVVAPMHPLLRNVRVVKTLSNVDIDVDTSSFSKPPFSVTDVGNQKIIEWRFDTFSADATDDLGFDILFKNPLPNEKRLVSYKTALTYDDISGNPVRTELDPQFVTVYSSIFQIVPATDKASYAANDMVQITSTVKNLSSTIGTGTVKISIKDTNNVLVAELGSTSPQSIAVGGTNVFSGVNFATGNTYAGSYKVVAEMINTAGQVIASASTPFTISSAAGTGLKLSMSTDKQQYIPSETVRISPQLSNTQSNAPVDNIQVVTTVTNPDGTVRFTKTETLAQLPAANTKNYAYSLPLSGAAPGQYAVKVTATAGTTTVQSTSSFAVTASSSNGSGLTGTVVVSPAQV